MADNLMQLIRPPWIELLKLQTKEDFDTAAARLFGNRPGEAGKSSQPYRADQYSVRFGIDIYQYRGFYAEIGGTDSPVGPVTPASSRVPIFPILAIHQTNRGNYTVQGLTGTVGFHNRDRGCAWIKADLYEALLGDTMFEEIVNETERIKQATAKKEPSQRNVVVAELPGRDDLSPAERALVDKILRNR